MKNIASVLATSALTITTLAPLQVHAADHQISQKNKEFSVSEISVKAGDTLTFKNDDTVTHNVFSSNKVFEFNTKTQAPGESKQVPVTGEGSVEVRCAIHPKMKLLIKISK